MLSLWMLILYPLMPTPDSATSDRWHYTWFGLHLPVDAFHSPLARAHEYRRLVALILQIIPLRWLCYHNDRIRNWVHLLSTRNRRQAAGLCLHCGYDLRASPIRCPECGMPKEQLLT